MKVACIQTDIKVGDFDYNISKAKQFISEAATKGAKLICLPELFATGVTLKTNNLEENNPGRTCEFLSKQAKEKKVYLLSSFIEKNNSNLPKNTMVVFNPEGLLVAKYSKNHVFTFGKENESYSNGEGVVSFSLDDFNVSTMICYDLRFPELFRIATDNKVNAFIVIANWPNPRKEHWRTLLKARAIENQAFVIGINRVGHSEEFSFFGSSMIISPKGEILMEADDKEGVFLEDIDIKEVTNWRNTFSALKDKKEYYFFKNNSSIPWDVWEDNKKYSDMLIRRSKGKDPLMESAKFLVKLIKPVYKPSFKVLDVCCSSAHYLVGLKQLDDNIDYYGLDSTKYLIDAAKNIFKNKAKLVVGDIYNMPYANK